MLHPGMVCVAEKRSPIIRYCAQATVLVAQAASHVLFLKLTLDQIKRKQERKKRRSSLLGQRVDWKWFVAENSTTPTFRRHLRMEYGSFEKLLTFIRPRLVVDNAMGRFRGGAIIPEVRLYCVLRWLAGGSYTDILYFCGISKPSFFAILWSTIRAINKARELVIKFPQTVQECLDAADGFRSISFREAIETCVCCVDGYHLQICTPSKKQVSNVRSFYSGHYNTYGMNIQGACDHHSRFVFLGVAGPGVLGDRDAVFQCPLGNMIENLPGLFCAIGDCAYQPTEHLVPIFGGPQANVAANSNFNFYASQCRIRIEMAFGMMSQKWGILKRPLTCKLSHVKDVVLCIAKLHNYCINERLSKNLIPCPNGSERTFSRYEQCLREYAASHEYNASVSHEYPQWSLNRERLVARVSSKGLSRPRANVLKET
jgi:hypothetical protein